MAGKKFGGDKRKRELMKTSNPRGNKRGGMKYKKSKPEEIDFSMYLHLKYHHSKNSKKICKGKKCPYSGRIIKSEDLTRLSRAFKK